MQSTATSAKVAEKVARTAGAAGGFSTRKASHRASMSKQSSTTWVTRLRAWWAGSENAEIYARYGERSGLFAFLMEWKGSLVALFCISSVLLNRSNNTFASKSLENAELNRSRFYKRDFVPEYMENAPKGLYSAAPSYHYMDESTGLKVNMDNKMAGPSRVELRDLMINNPPVVSPDMVRAARALQKAHATGDSSHA